MMHYAQPPPTVIDITTDNFRTIRSLIEQHEPHRDPHFQKIDEQTLRVVFPRGFDADNEFVLRQLISELQNLGARDIKINR